MATATSGSPSLAALKAFDDAVALVLPKVPLTHREFARRYITMPPNGPHGNEPYRESWQPVLGVLWDELDRNYWREVVVTGPVQASKSFGALVVPTLRDIVELRYSPIVGVPEADMFADKWDQDFKPVMQASSALRWLLPDIGSGQRGGRVRDRVTFGNGTDLKVMSRGGQATNKAGYTAPRLRITEAAGFSEASGSERDEESDAYRQLIGRLGAFDLTDPRRLVMIEGTGTIEEHLPWRLRGKDDDDVLVSTRSRLLSPCPHCEAWISPEREHLVGWQSATSMMQALEQARFICPSCEQAIDDDQRRASMQDVRIVHCGQDITPGGEVTGEIPPVLRLWFRWSAWHNCLINAGTVAVAEWEAAQVDEGTIDRENAERDLCQKKWALPFKSKLAENEPLNPQVVRKRVNEWQRGLLPADTVRVTIGVDIGAYTSYWFAIAFREGGELHVPAYGRFNVKLTKSDDLSSRIQHSLEEFNENVVLVGFPVEGSDGMRLPDAVGVDLGYMPDDVAKALKTFGRGWSNRWQGMRGRGGSAKQFGKNNGGYNHPTHIVKNQTTGRRWYADLNFERGIPEITFDADYWLLHMHDALRASSDSKTAMTFHRKDEPKQHDKVSIQLTAEELTKKWDPAKGGLVEKWVKKAENHWGDCAKMAMVMADVVSMRARPRPRTNAPVEQNGNGRRFKPAFSRRGSAR